MAQLDQSIQELITTNLPAMAASSLGDFIAQAKREADRLAKALRDNDELSLDNNKLRAANLKLVEAAEQVEAAAVVNSNMTEALRKRELELDRREARLDAMIAGAELKGTKESMAAFLANVTVRTHVQERVGVPVAGAVGGNGYGGSAGFVQEVNQSHTTEETKS